MIPEQLLELLVLEKIFDQLDKDDKYYGFMYENYNMQKMHNRYLELGKEFIRPYKNDNN